MTPQDHTKKLQDRPQRPQGRPKSGPRAPQIAPRSPNIGPGGPQKVPRPSKSEPRPAQDALRSPQKHPKSIRTPCKKSQQRCPRPPKAASDSRLVRRTCKPQSVRASKTPSPENGGPAAEALAFRSGRSPSRVGRVKTTLVKLTFPSL